MDTKIVTSIIIAVATIVVIIVFDRVIRRLKNTEAVIDSAPLKTTIVATGRIIKFVFVLFVVFTIFGINGINLTSIITSLGLAGAVAALAAQDLMKDLLSGIYISGEKMYSPGDTIRYNGNDGVVISFNLRSTKVRLLENDNIMYISNRNIYEVIVLSHNNYVDIPLSYEVSTDKAERIMADITSIVGGSELVENIECLGIQKLDRSAVIYRILYSTETINRGVVARLIRKTLLEVLAKEGLSVPYEKIELVPPV